MVIGQKVVASATKTRANGWKAQLSMVDNVDQPNATPTKAELKKSSSCSPDHHGYPHLSALDSQQDIHVAYPRYATTSVLDELRKTDYAYLDEQEHVYLDYTGSGLAARSQHVAHQQRQAATLFGNPHTLSPTSNAATAAVENTRRRVLQFFRASPDEYVVIFTPNATGAARLVGESYPFSRGRRLVMTSDNHNSVNGVREYARKRHVTVEYVRSTGQDLRIKEDDLKKALGRETKHHRGLFAYPAQSNFSGVKHALEYVSLAQKRGYDVLLDAAAYLPTAAIDLSAESAVHPEFIMVSWYKLFGYPTGCGCLIARKSALSRLKRPWFSGGTVQAVSVGLKWHTMARDEAAFEDGTVNFLSIPDVAVGLDWLDSIGMGVIATRIQCLTGWFIDRLATLRHADGRAMIRLYGPRTTDMRGGTVAFNILDFAGKIVDERIVAQESAEARISLRTGCFCNPGCGEDALNIRPSQPRTLLGSRSTDLDTYIKMLGLSSAGAIRVSFGLASNTQDVDRFFTWLQTTYTNRVTDAEGLKPRDRC